MVLVALAGMVAVVAGRLGLEAAGATDELIAAVLLLCLVVTGFVGSFVLMHYSPPGDHD
jgi:hypothetical protein